MPNSYAKGYYYNSEYRLKEMFRAKYEIYLQKESLAADIRALINERNVLTKNNAALTNERDVANKRLYNIQNSLSFKIGRLVTLIPRMVRNFIRGE